MLLGEAYDFGRGVPKDHKQAAHWYRLAAEQGNAMAQVDLGRLYHLGQGVPQDFRQAAHWYRLAAEQGEAEAQVRLGTLYHFGQGVPRDQRQAAHWYRLASEQGQAAAQFFLAGAYEFGDGVPKDYVAAYQWLNLAAASGDHNVSDDAARVRDRLASLMTPAQIAEGQRLSAQWQPHPSSRPSEQPGDQAAADGAPGQESGEAIFGSGFFVSRDGRVLTNAHVVKNCVSISVAAEPASMPSAARVSRARVLGRDVTNDLALLATSLQPGAAVPGWRFSVRQGEDIAIYGFPLAGLLASGGEVTTGTVAALSGVNQDGRELEITAPIQPGNSGGPVFDRSGNVVGIVVAKLDALKIAQVTQDIPENVGFAIKASVARDFLESTTRTGSKGDGWDAFPVYNPDSHPLYAGGGEPGEQRAEQSWPVLHQAPATATLATPDLAALARQITVQIVCRQ